MVKLLPDGISFKVLIAGHRGNTRYWFKKYIKSGADLIEVDVDKNGKDIILTHRDQYKKPILIREKLAHMLETIHLRKPLTLIEALDLARERGLGVILDIKKPGIVNEIKEIITTVSFPLGKVILTSKWHDDLKYIAEHWKEVKVLLSLEEHPVNVTQLLKQTRAHGISIRIDFLTDKLIRELRKERFLIAVWPVNMLEQVIDLSRKGVDIVITDNINVIKALKGIKREAGPRGFEPRTTGLEGRRPILARRRAHLSPLLGFAISGFKSSSPGVF